MKYNEILHGPALDQLKSLDSDSVDCCITSPPYWALRDYKQQGQLGLEPTFQEYITKLIEIFDQVKRVLKKEGSCWVNMGDTYSNSGGTQQPQRDHSGNNWFNTRTEPYRMAEKLDRPASAGIPQKSLCLIPQRFQIAMVDAGWICRNTIIWYKPNCMPSSAKDRFTVDFEYLFFFTKSAKYYFETQYESVLSESVDEKSRRCAIGRGWKPESHSYADWYFNVREKKSWHNHKNDLLMGNGHQKRGEHYQELTHPYGRIKRCVWKIPTQPFSDAHFAVFPPALVATPLKATCPEYICKRCGKAREKITEETGEYLQLGHSTSRKAHAVTLNDSSGFVTNLKKERIETGLTDCGCNAGFDGGIVLDPFMGSGTVAVVAMQNARNFVGIELNQAYIDMAHKRLEPYLLQTRLL